MNRRESYNFIRPYVDHLRENLPREEQRDAVYKLRSCFLALQCDNGIDPRHKQLQLAVAVNYISRGYTPSVEVKVGVGVLDILVPDLNLGIETSVTIPDETLLKRKIANYSPHLRSFALAFPRYVFAANGHNGNGHVSANDILELSRHSARELRREKPSHFKVSGLLLVDTNPPYTMSPLGRI